MQTFEDGVVAGDGGSGVPLLFDNDIHGGFTLVDDEQSFMGSSTGSKASSRASNSDTKAISPIA